MTRPILSGPIRSRRVGPVTSRRDPHPILSCLVMSGLVPVGPNGSHLVTSDLITAGLIHVPLVVSGRGLSRRGASSPI